MTQALRRNVFSSIMKQEAGWFDSVSTGQLVNRLSADTQLVGSTLSSNISDGLRSLFMVSAGTGMMVWFLIFSEIYSLCYVIISYVIFVYLIFFSR